MTCLTFTFLIPSIPKNAQKRLFNFFTPKNSFSDQITPINDMQHDITHFHIFLPKQPKNSEKDQNNFRLKKHFGAGTVTI